MIYIYIYHLENMPIYIYIYIYQPILLMMTDTDKDLEYSFSLAYLVRERDVANNVEGCLIIDKNLRSYDPITCNFDLRWLLLRMLVLLRHRL